MQRRYLDNKFLKKKTPNCLLKVIKNTKTKLKNFIVTFFFFLMGQLPNFLNKNIELKIKN